MLPEVIADYRCRIGENPLWHPLEQRVYWTDIPNGQLFRYEPATGEHEECYRGRPVGGFTVQADGALLLFMEGGAIARWHDGELDYVLPEIPAEQGFRFNDVIADPLGRVFCGTIAQQPGSRPGRLYRLDTDGSLHLVLEDVLISNGLGFSPDRRQLYYTDSGRRTITLFDYEVQTGALTRPRIWLQLPDGAGVPDGLTVDAEGYVWSARWDGGAVYRYTPEGREVERIPFPARKVTSAAFGGPELRELYVTTALAEGTRDEEGAEAGALFRLRAEVKGLPDFFSRVGL